MITIPTVLVFGAGVSHPFGFPLGIGLRNNIIENLAPSNGFYRELCEIGFSDGEVNGFREVFRDSGKESVDAFLEHRTDYLEVGKAAIAQELTRYETHNVLFKSRGNNFYFYLYNHLNATPEEFENNRLTVITYNYDRSFEHFLFTALRNSYRLSDDKTAELLGHIPIIHLHGHLGLLPWQGEGGREYGGGTETRLADIRLASKSIKIIHEKVDVEQDTQFQRAYGHINEAQRIVFLGFGYDKTNLERLRLPNSVTCRIFGSSYNLTDNERANLNGKFFLHKAILGLGHMDAFNYLRECVSLS